MVHDHSFRSGLQKVYTPMLFDMGRSLNIHFGSKRLKNENDPHWRGPNMYLTTELFHKTMLIVKRNLDIP